MAAGMSTTLRNARLDAITAAIDAAAAAGKIWIMDGTRPDTGAAITTQDTLAVLTFAYPSAPEADDGVLTFYPLTSEDAAIDDGTATWARVLTDGNAFVMDLSVGGPGSGADLELVNVNIEIGEEVAIAACTITEGGA